MAVADLHGRAADLIGCVTLDPLPCRVVIHPGPNVPFDSCEATSDGRNGQLWVAVNGLTPGWPTPTGSPASCGQQLTVEWELGIVRCAAVLGDDGSPPVEDAVDADQALQMCDAQALYAAIACCWPSTGRNLIVDRWDPIPPAGGCVGGLWTFRTTLDV